MAHLNAPIIYLPISKYFPTFCHMQRSPVCADIEFLAVECTEAYGAIRAKEKCKDLLKDYRECITNEKQLFRVYMMQQEKLEKEKRGEQPGQLPDPPIDAFY